MDVYYIDKLNTESKLPQNDAMAVGLFDGVHLGHRALLEAARAQGGRLGVLTFSGLKKDGGALTSEAERFSLLDSFGVQNCFVLNFDLVRKLMPEQFIDDVLIAMLGISSCTVGFNFRFGYNRTGDAAFLVRYLRERGIGGVVKAAELLDGLPISSSRIKAELSMGQLAEAARLLGRDYSFSGEIVNGAHIGRTLGIPTINIDFDREKLIPPHGVYASRVLLDGVCYDGITNIGVRPTVGGESVSVETNLLSASGDYYGETAEIILKKFLRKEKKFPDLDALKTQIEADIEITRNYFRAD